MKNKKDLSKTLGQSYKENEEADKQIMQRLFSGKGYTGKEKEDDQEEEDNQIIKSLLDTNVRKPTPFPSQLNVNQKIPTQGEGMYPNLNEMQALEHGGNASMSTVKIDEIYTMGGETIGENMTLN